MEAFWAQIRDFLNDSGMRPKAIRLISVGVPASVMGDLRTIFCAPNLADAKGKRIFENYPFAERLEKLCGIPTLVNKDVNNLICYDIHANGLEGIVAGCYIGTGAGGGVDKSGDAELQTMISEVAPKYQLLTFDDAETGMSLQYYLFVPEDYDASQSYPLIQFIPDSSVVGKDAEAVLTQGWGGLIWAADAEQAKHASFIVVPVFTETIVDDNFNHSEQIDVAVRLLQSLTEEYSIDANRLYTTGQSMGGMTSFYLNVAYTNLQSAQEAGNKKAARYIGLMYEQGLGVGQDYGAAAAWYGQGVAAGDLTSGYYLGLLYKQRLGVEQDYAKADELFASVAVFDNKSAAGVVAAGYELGQLYEQGLGVEQDMEKALALYEEAAGYGDEDAMATLERLEPES